MYYSSSKEYKLLLNLFGNKPDKWDNNLNGIDRIRFIINVFTRIRFCSIDDQIELETKGNKIKNYVSMINSFNSNITLETEYSNIHKCA